MLFKYFYVFSKIHKAIGLDATKRLPAGTQIGSAPMNMETYKYFESIDLVLSEIFGCTEASGPQICNLEGMVSSLNYKICTFITISVIL